MPPCTIIEVRGKVIDELRLRHAKSVALLALGNWATLTTFTIGGSTLTPAESRTMLRESSHMHVFARVNSDFNACRVSEHLMVPLPYVSILTRGAISSSHPR